MVLVHIDTSDIDPNDIDNSDTISGGGGSIIYFKNSLSVSIVDEFNKLRQILWQLN